MPLNARQRRRNLRPVKIVEKHALTLRLLHWLNVPLLLLMIWSGVLIYWANDVYPGFFPEWFYDLFHVRNRLAEGLSIHFFVGWLFVLNGFLYVTWFVVSGHWREVLPSRETWRWAWPTILSDMGLWKGTLPSWKFNAMQKLAYSTVIVLALGLVTTGMAIYKPVQLGWLTAALGGYKAARAEHFGAMILLVGFIGVHLVQVARAGWNAFRAMVAGFEVDEG